MTQKIEVAKLLARMGFEIDTTQLEKFENLTRGVRASTVKLARDLRQTNSQLTAVSSKLKSVNNGLNSVNSRKGAGSLSQSYASLSKNVNVAQTSLNRMSNTVTTIEPKLLAQITTVGRLAQAWADYSSKVKESNRSLRDRPSVSPTRPPSSRGLGSGSGSGSGSSSGSSFGAGLAGGAVGRFAGAFAPASAIAGGALTAGYLAKQTIDVGRDFTAMKQILLASSKNTEDFNRNLEFTRKTTNELGTNVIEFGKAYAKTIQSVGDKLPRKQTEEMFKNFSQLMVVMHSSDDDQKGVFRAMSQMFSKGKIQMEEINQMAERNVPALAMLTRAYKELGMTQAEFEKAQQKGQLDPAKFLPLMAKYASEFAKNNGALEKAMQSSVTQQGIFMNRMRELANQIMESGLDKALGDMFKGLTKVANALTPLVIWLAKAVIGLGKFIGVIYDFAKAHPIITAVLTAMVGGLVGLRLAFRAGITVGGAFFIAMIRGLQMLKMALIRTAIFAIFVAIAEVLVSLYEHMNGENNWISVTIAWLKLFGSEIELAYQRFLTMMTAIKVAIRDSVIGQFFSKLFSFDFSQVGGNKDNDPNKSQSVMPVAQAVKQAQVAPSYEERLRRMQVSQGYANTIPNNSGGQLFGKLAINHNMNISGGKTIVQTSQTQTVNLGGLRQ